MFVVFSAEDDDVMEVDHAEVLKVMSKYFSPLRHQSTESCRRVPEVERHSLNS